MSTGLAANSQTLRERVLNALDHVWCPLRADDELRLYLEGVWGQPVAADDLAQLMADERRALTVASRDRSGCAWGSGLTGALIPSGGRGRTGPCGSGSSIRTESRPVGIGCCGSCIARRLCPGIQGQTP